MSFRMGMVWVLRGLNGSGSLHIRWLISRKALEMSVVRRDGETQGWLQEELGGVVLEHLEQLSISIFIDKDDDTKPVICQHINHFIPVVVNLDDLPRR